MSTSTQRLIFSHANGFPAGVYRVLFERWRAAGYRVEAIDRFGHDAAYPVTSNWHRLRDQLLDFMAQGGAEPAWLVGHSLGGMLSLLATCHAPERVRGLVLLDSPVITGWRAQSVRLLKHSGLIPRLSPGQVSQRRRNRWDSRDAVLKHFQSKPAFARWDPRVLADYIQSGFDEVDGQIELGFRREIETRIYNTLPHHLGALLRHQSLPVPAAFIAGTASNEIRQGGIASSKKLAGDRFVWFEGTHLYPMERPDDTAREVLRLIATMS